MREISLITAWKMWFSGQAVHDVALWHLNITWWSRAGKLLEFLAGLAIVSDILGPERIRALGKSLHSKMTLRSSIASMLNSWRWLIAQFRYLVSIPFSAKNKEYEIATQKFAADKLNYLVGAILTGIVVIQQGVPDWFQVRWAPNWLNIIFLYLATCGTVAPLVTLGVSLASIVLGLAVDSLLVEPLARFLELEQVDRRIKMIALLLLAFGFHFDLLTS